LKESGLDVWNRAGFSAIDEPSAVNAHIKRGIIEKRPSVPGIQIDVRNGAFSDGGELKAMSFPQRQGLSASERTSEEHKESEADFRTIIDTIPVIAWRTVPDGSGEFWNRRWHDYTGISFEAARGWGWRTAIHPEDLDELEKKWRADLSSGQAGSVEGRLRRFDGQYRWFLFPV
jgi:PAS domain S-box-containing protein